jgi:hypothetical protein
MVGEYQRSGMPFVTSSNGAELKTATSNVVQISFPRVTRWFEVRGLDASSAAAEIRIGFTENGVNSKGAVTGSIPIGEFNTNGTQKWRRVNVQGSVSDAMLANHANYFVIPSTTTSEAPGVRYELMCTDLFLTMHSAHNSGFCVVAGLTDISRESLALTGSNGYQGVG